ncbi:hypothetical protein QQS21_002859 [Conoideocrella luteorostrata]|uniref:Alpha N-terminal protein methyltransferase 1 n=1 Tax=Conoideocrella luteorostrata TaxID=1105319 RepID=A0AAJ0G0Y0_9HYPO|nr:hypothetical protein QQS21_002859 [Conoideocrella luteorostrata]
MISPPNSPDSRINAAHGLSYWGDIAADENGMLGGVPSLAGFSSLSRIDLQGSRTFLGIGVRRGREGVDLALEGGAGIGRIPEGLLLKVAKQADIIEPVSKFTDKLKGKAGVRHIYNVGLEDWQPAADVIYDLIWVQWCVGHLTNEQLVGFLETCEGVLNSAGVIVLKENLSTGDEDVFDAEDSRVMRRDEKFRSILEKADLRLVARRAEGAPRDEEQ